MELEITNYKAKKIQLIRPRHRFTVMALLALSQLNKFVSPNKDNVLTSVASQQHFRSFLTQYDDINNKQLQIENSHILLDYDDYHILDGGYQCRLSFWMVQLSSIDRCYNTWTEK